jgi:hypothetical protein
MGASCRAGFLDRVDGRARDAGLARLRRLTLALGVGAGALVAVVSGLAAKAFPGRHPARPTVRPTAAASSARTRPGKVREAPPPLVPVDQGSSAAAAPSAPPSPPAPTQAPPVVVSGGS